MQSKELFVFLLGFGNQGFDFLGVSLEIHIVVIIVFLFFLSELVQGVDDLAAVPLAVVDGFGSTHNGHVQLTGTGADLVPVDEVHVREFTAVQDAVLDGEGFASAEEHGAEVTVGVHGGEVTGLVNVSAELGMDGAGMTKMKDILIRKNKISCYNFN